MARQMQCLELTYSGLSVAMQASLVDDGPVSTEHCIWLPQVGAYNV